MNEERQLQRSVNWWRVQFAHSRWMSKESMSSGFLAGESRDAHNEYSAARDAYEKIYGRRHPFNPYKRPASVPDLKDIPSQAFKDVPQLIYFETII